MIDVVRSGGVVVIISNNGMKYMTTTTYGLVCRRMSAGISLKNR